MGRGRHQGMHQPARRIDADMRFHAEVPFTAFLGLVHFGISFLPLVFRRAGGFDDRGIYDGSFAHQNSLAF